jgi:hypothetical protein
MRELLQTTSREGKEFCSFLTNQSLPDCLMIGLFSKTSGK